MTANELKKYLIKEDKIEYILESIGCTKIHCDENKNIITAAQPSGDNPMGVVISTRESEDGNYYLNYYSYSRGINIDKGYDIFYLIQQIKNFSFAETMRYVHKLLGLDYKFNGAKKPTKVEEKYDPLAIFKKAASKKKICNVLDFNIIDEKDMADFSEGMIFYTLFKEGIIKKTIEKFKLSYSYKWKRTIFPHHLWYDKSVCIGYNARTSIENPELFDIPKYYITPGMKKEWNLYGLAENYSDIERLKYITIFESEKSVCKRDSRNDPSGVAISGHSLSSEQVRIILGLNINEVVIAMDNDIPEEEVWDMCEKFYRLRIVSYIKDTKGLFLEEKDSPADASNKIYKYLFDHRIKYDEKLHHKYLKSLGRI